MGVKRIQLLSGVRCSETSQYMTELASSLVVPVKPKVNSFSQNFQNIFKTFFFKNPKPKFLHIIFRETLRKPYYQIYRGIIVISLEINRGVGTILADGYFCILVQIIPFSRRGLSGKLPENPKPLNETVWTSGPPV